MSDKDTIKRGDVFEAIYALHTDGKEGIENAPWNSYGEELRDALNAIAEIPAVSQEMSVAEESRMKAPWRWLEDFAREYKDEQYAEFVLAAKRAYISSVEKMYGL